MDGVADSIMSGQEQHELPQTSEVVTSNNSTDLINNPESLPSSSGTAQIAPSSLSGLNPLALVSTSLPSSDYPVPATAASLAEETFKIPTLPPAHTRSIPADIAHIIAMGLNEPDPADEELASGKGTSNYEQVVKEMREKAGFGTIKQESEAGNELDNVEKEMEVRGVVRVAEESGIKMEVEEEEEEDEDDVKPDLMNGDRQSSPFSSSSSSSDDDIELESLLLPAQALSQTKGKAKKNRKRSNKPSADSDLSDDDINTSAAPATEHEIAQPEIVLPALEKIPEGNEIKSFGSVVSIIENVVVLKAEGEKKVLDEGCLCCWADGTVIGTIFEVFGSVIQPFYSLRFPTASPPSAEVYTIGKLVYYSPSMASYVFTQQLRAQKGSDASNVWDEEIGANEMEWSDDEEEQEYKRNLKNDRKARTGSVTPGPPSERERKSRAPSQAPSVRSRSASRAPQPQHSSLPARPNFDALPYDEDVYTPLTRPQNLHLQNSNPPPPPQASTSGGDRQMFDRRSGGRGAEFEFDRDQDESDDDEAETGSISSTFEVDERYREMDILDREEEERSRVARNANTTSRGGRGRGARGGDRGRGGRGGSESGRASGGDRGRGNGRGRGDNRGATRGGGSDRPNERIVAALPMRPIGLPAKPNFPSPAVEERRTSASGPTPVLPPTPAAPSSTFDFSASSAATSSSTPASLPSNPSLQRQQGYDSSQQYPNQQPLHFGNSPFQGFGSSSMQNPCQNRFPVQQQYPQQYPSQHYQQQPQPQQQQRPNHSFSPSASYSSAQSSSPYSPAQGLPAATASAGSATPIASGPISVQGGHLNPRFLAQNQPTPPSPSNSAVFSPPHPSAPQQASSYRPSGTGFAYQSQASQYPQQYPRQQQNNEQYNQQQFYPSHGYQQQNSYKNSHGAPQPNYGQQQPQGYRTDSNQFQAALQQWQQTSGNGQSGGSSSNGEQQGYGQGNENEQKKTQGR